MKPVVPPGYACGPGLETAVDFQCVDTNLRHNSRTLSPPQYTRNRERVN